MRLILLNCCVDMFINFYELCAKFFDTVFCSYDINICVLIFAYLVVVQSLSRLID
jgi:hypothetical protein